MNAEETPLVANFAPRATAGWRGDGRVDIERFIGTARSLAERIPAGGFCLNLCDDRLNFALGLAAALLRNVVSLLPPSRAPGVLRDLTAHYSPACTFADRPDALAATAIDLRDWPAPATGGGVPAIDPGQPAVTLFTSGSTGTPRPHSKSWGALVAGAAALRARLPLAEGSVILGTVPPQHMWGFEATVMLPLQSGCAIDSRAPLLPADLAAMLAAMAPPRWLVSVPLHLQACVAADLRLPALAGVLSATSRLEPALARAFEALAGAPVLEIYGSTETGAVATRRPAGEDAFELLQGLRLHTGVPQHRIASGHVGAAVTLQDDLEPISATRFLLGDRAGDLVKIGGKRASLVTLDHELSCIPGVLEGVFWLPERAHAPHRLSAFVVAPGVTRTLIFAALRERIDPAFLPRPLLLVDALPRDALGKIPRARLSALLARATGNDLTRAT